MVSSIIDKARVLGATIQHIPTACGHHCELIKFNNEKYTLYIPDDVTHLNKTQGAIDIRFSSNLPRIIGTLNVLGGQSLKSTAYMFSKCSIQYINLTGLCTKNVEIMQGMFFDCSTCSIEMGAFDTSNVTDMSWMFSDMWLQSDGELNLNFNTQNVTDMQGMFSKALFEGTSESGHKRCDLDLSSFDTRNVRTMDEMFSELAIKSLNISSFDTRNVTSFNKMFYRLKIDATLNVENITAENGASTTKMFTASKLNGGLEISNELARVAITQI